MKYFLFIAILFIASCSSNANNTQEESLKTEMETNGAEVINKVLSVDEFGKQVLLDTILVLIDVRTPEEFRQGYIADANNLNFYDNSFKFQLAQLNKETPTYLYCKSGGRSGKTAIILKEMGFKEVYDLDGGFNAWKSKNKPITKD